MKRVLTATGLAAMFAVGLAAQSTTGGSTAQTTTAGGGQGQGRGGPRTHHRLPARRRYGRAPTC